MSEKNTRTSPREFSTLAEFAAFPKAPRGFSKIYHNGLPIDIGSRMYDEAPLVVVFHGRRPPTLKLPYLAGFGITSDLDVSRLSISDSSLHLSEELLLSWFAGNYKQPYLQDDILGIIRKFAEDWNAPRVIFFGGSGGGFASIEASRKMPESVAVVWNPQTDMLKYHHNYVNQYLEIGWPWWNSKLPTHVNTSLIDLFHQIPHQGQKILYMQVESDKHHVEHHLSPFLASIEKKQGISLLRGNWVEGHTPPPKSILRSALEAGLAEDVDAAARRLSFKSI